MQSTSLGLVHIEASALIVLLQVGGRIGPPKLVGVRVS